MRRLSHLPTLKLHVSAAIITFSHSFMRPSPRVCVCLQMIIKVLRKNNTKHLLNIFVVVSLPVCSLCLQSQPSQATPKPEAQVSAAKPAQFEVSHVHLQYLLTSSFFSYLEREEKHISPLPVFNRHIVHLSAHFLSPCKS